MSKPSELTKNFVTSLFLANYKISGAELPDIRLSVKRGFYACDLVQYKYRSVEEADNVLVVLEFTTHQRAVDLGKKVNVSIGQFSKDVELRVVGVERKKTGTSYSYIAHLQGDTTKPIFKEK